jgi:hypothetical protein
MKVPVDWSFALFVLILAALVTALFTSPLVFLWRTHLAGFEPSDAFTEVWSAWWFDTALFELNQSPARLNMIQYPVEFHHPLLVAAPWTRVWTLVGLRVLGPAAAYNVHLFASYVLTWGLMALLCLKLTGNRVGAVFGGAAFTFCANRTLHAVDGHLTLVSTYAYPLLVLCLWQAVERPGFWRGLALGGAMIVGSTVDLTPLAYFTIPVVVAVLTHFLVTDHEDLLSRPALRTLAIGFGLATVCLAPLMWPLISRGLRGELFVYQAPGIEEYSADMLGLVIPPPGHFLCSLWSGLRRFSVTLLPEKAYMESVVYMGWITLILALLGAVTEWGQRADIRLWVALASGASALSLGPLLRVGGELVTIGGRPVPTPYALLMHIPLLSWGRTPARLGLTAAFALAILAAYGARQLVVRVRNPRGRGALALAIVGLVLLDGIYILPWPMADVVVPDFYQTIANDERSVAILDLPLLDHSADQYYLRYQMVHGHAITGGHIYRRPEEARAMLSEFQQLAASGGDVSTLARYGIGYVILHPPFLENARLDLLRQHAEEHLGPSLYSDKRIIVFAVPNALEIAPAPVGGR